MATVVSDDVSLANELQFHVMRGFCGRFHIFVGARIVDADRFRDWLLRNRERFRSHFDVRHDGTLHDVAACVGFSSSGLTALGCRLAGTVDPSFSIGFRSRLAEFTSGARRFSVRRLPISTGPLACVLLFTSEDAPRLGEMLSSLGRSGNDAGLEIATLDASPMDNLDLEDRQSVLGFADGISNPDLARLIQNFEVFGPTSAHDAETLGDYIILAGDSNIEASSSPDPKGTRFVSRRYGSYLVWLRYRIDRTGFWTAMKSASRDITRDYQSLDWPTEEALGGKMLGRWPSGAPMSLTPLRDDKALGADSARNNDFRHGTDDLRGLRCPLQAHIRKTHPRQDVSTDVKMPRILRHGMSFIDSSDGGAGIDFLCYQSSIAEQFETIFFEWANNPDFPAVGVGVDPLISLFQHTTFNLPFKTNYRLVKYPIQLPETLVSCTDGEYFFVPSLPELDRMASCK